MGSSLGFGSTRGDSIALFRLAFAAASSFADLTLPPTSNTPAHSSKGTPSGYPATEASGQHPLTACRHAVSGAISLPSRGAFHLSLTVLVHYRWPGVFSLGGWSPRIPPGFLVSRGTWVAAPSRPRVVYRPVTVSGAAFQRTSTARAVAHSVARLPPHRATPTTPTPQRRQA